MKDLLGKTADCVDSVREAAGISKVNKFKETINMKPPSLSKEDFRRKK